MKECLVTKLKRVVNDDSLEFFGALVVKLYTGENGYLGVYGSTEGIKSELEVLTEGVNIVSVAGGGVKLSDKKCILGTIGVEQFPGVMFDVSKRTLITVKITQKYNLASLPNILEIIPYNRTLNGVDQLRLFLTEYGFKGKNENITVLPELKNATRVTIIDSSSYDSTFTGKISDLMAKLNPSILTSFTLMLRDCDYDISDIAKLLGNFTALTFLELLNETGKVTGTLESFVAEQRKNGRTSCESLDFSYGSSFVTFNGKPAYKDLSRTRILSWTESTITYDGETIEA